jgi:endo-1,4-beta-xylanase
MKTNLIYGNTLCKHGIFFALFVISSINSIAQIQTNVPALKDVFAKDFYIGCLLSYAHIGFSTDSAISGQSAVVDAKGGYLVKYHMNSMGPGNNMKPVYTVNITSSAAAYTAATSQAAKDSINIHPIVAFNGNLIAQLNWAKKQGFTFRGHTLVWHNQTPDELFYTGYSTSKARVSKDTMILRMDNYIREVIRLIHAGWPGLLSAIDAVNEAIDESTGKVRTSSNQWYTTFGDSSYVMKAFQIARKYTVLYGETQIKLYYNDYNTHIALKANGIANLVSPIFHAGYLDGLGMQEHDALSTPTAEDWIASYNKFDTVCTEMAVTELDVIANSSANSNYPSASLLASQANQYGQLFKCFVERSYKSGRGKIISVSKDGLNDSLTYKTLTSSSLWTPKDSCKPAFYAVAHVGQYYNIIDSLIISAGLLQQSNYTPVSWSNLTSALAYATTIKTQNYSVTVSADTALGKAKDTLIAAINGLVISSTSVQTADGNTPKVFALNQNYPNPFNPTTTISFSLPVKNNIRLVLMNVLGQTVKEIANGDYAAGNHKILLDATKLSSGVYFYKLEAGNFNNVKKLILLK